MEASDQEIFCPEPVTQVRHIRGFWIISIMSQCYGGSEEGGWWYDCGETLAAIPHTRSGDFTVTISENGLDDYSLERWRDDIPADVKLLMDRLVEEGYGKFDNQYHSTSPRHDSLAVHWSENITMGFPDERPRYE